MQNHQSSEIGSGGVVYCFHDRFLLLESVIVSILKGVYCLFFSRSTMSGNFPSDEVGKSYTQPVGKTRHLERSMRNSSSRAAVKAANRLLVTPPRSEGAVCCHRMSS